MCTTIPESQPPAAELQAEIAVLRSRLDYVLGRLEAMCLEAGVGHLMAVNAPAPRPQRHLSAVR